ncbi:unnamed protein product [Lactuca virosa]|uniref:Uncharacterized protein n=1 Tax=Lactuca virosa TaxID=75947 RepID=A0AAU9NMI2_9ASTR|nr:unnamed protein product [Lactuca virosa]
MAPITKTTLLISLLVLLYTCSANGIRDVVFSNGVMNPLGRKLALVDAMVDDYNDPGANPKHDPRKGGGHGPPAST